MLWNSLLFILIIYIYELYIVIIQLYETRDYMWSKCASFANDKYVIILVLISEIWPWKNILKFLNTIRSKTLNYCSVLELLEYNYIIINSLNSHCNEPKCWVSSSVLLSGRSSRGRTGSDRWSQDATLWTNHTNES